MNEDNPIVKAEKSGLEPWKRRTEEVRLANEFVSLPDIGADAKPYSNFRQRLFAHLIDCLLLSALIGALGIVIGLTDSNLIALVGRTHAVVLWGCLGFYGTLFCLCVPGLSIVAAVASIGYVAVSSLILGTIAEVAPYRVAMLGCTPMILDLWYRSQSESSPVRATIGKRLMGIYVADQQGNRLTFKHSLKRNISRTYAVPAFLLRPITAKWHQSKQTVYDSESETLVLKSIREKPDSSIKKLGS